MPAKGPPLGSKAIPGRVVATGLEMPARGGPSWTREQLWNAAEAVERRKDARVARKIEVALPAEMTAEQRQELVVTWVRAIAEGFAAWRGYGTVGPKSGRFSY